MYVAGAAPVNATFDTENEASGCHDCHNNSALAGTRPSTINSGRRNGFWLVEAPNDATAM